MELTTLDQYIEIFKDMKFSDSCQIVEKSLIYRYTDESFNKFCGCNMVGKRLRDIKTMFSSHVSIMREVPEKMFRENIRSYSYIIKLTDNVETYFITIQLNILYNTLTKEQLGLIVLSYKIENNNSVIKLFEDHRTRKDFVTFFNPGLNNNKSDLDLRSYEILSLLAMHKTYEEIADILSSVYSKTISKATLITHARRFLHVYFDVSNTKDLINEASSKGYIDYIPASLYKILTNIF